MRTLPLSDVNARLSEPVGDLDILQETLEVISDRPLMTEIRRGIRQIERGQTFSYEEVFGRRLRGKKRSSSTSRRADG